MAKKYIGIGGVEGAKIISTGRDLFVYEKCLV